MKARRFETLRVFISPVLTRFNYARKSSKWRKQNEHNSTTVSEWCPISKVKVGKHTYGHLNVHWYGTESERLDIGNYCSIAGEVHFILGGEHDYNHLSTFPFSEKIYHSGFDGICRGPIVVKDDVWIGFGAVILSGITIGQGCVIAAGSVVTKDVPPYSIWIGNKVIKKRFDDVIIRELMKIDYSSVEPDQYRNFADTYIDKENVYEIVRTLME